MDLTSAAIATLISAITSTIVTFCLAKLNSRKDLDAQLDGILKIAIQYPYLECREFTNAWTSDYDRSDEKLLRYEVYCTMVFNYLNRCSIFNGHNQKKLEKQIAVKDWARIHAKYWRDPTQAYENVDTYEPQFVELIEGYLKGK